MSVLISAVGCDVCVSVCLSALWWCVCTTKCQVCESNRHPAAEPCNHRTEPGATVQTCLSLAAGSLHAWSSAYSALRGVPTEQSPTTLRSGHSCSPTPALFRTVALGAVCLRGSTFRLVLSVPRGPVIHAVIALSSKALRLLTSHRSPQQLRLPLGLRRASLQPGAGNNQRNSTQQGAGAGSAFSLSAHFLWLHFYLYNPNNRRNLRNQMPVQSNFCTKGHRTGYYPFPIFQSIQRIQA